MSQQVGGRSKNFPRPPDKCNRVCASNKGRRRWLPQKEHLIFENRAKNHQVTWTCIKLIHLRTSVLVSQPRRGRKSKKSPEKVWSDSSHIFFHSSISYGTQALFDAGGVSVAAIVGICCCWSVSYRCGSTPIQFHPVFL